jgi:hypothetical protein
MCDDGTTNARPDPRCTSTGTVTVNLTPPNQPPTANSQSLTVAEDHVLSIALTGSDRR